MPRTIEFLEPRTLDEAVSLLDSYAGEARVLAGATAVTILLRQGLIHPAALISIGRLPGLHEIRQIDGALHFGALVTHRDVERSAQVREALPCLAEVFGTVANVRVRNAATVGGVLAEADYASDPPAAFLALDAVVEAHGPEGAREIPIAEFFQGFYATSLADNEIVTGIWVPIPEPGLNAVYEKFVTRSSEDRPCVGAFAAVRLADDKHACAELRVAVGAASETPQRFPDLESLAHDQPMTESLARTIADGYAERIDTLADLRGSAWYRTEMVRVWVRRCIQRAVCGAI
ncbi:MAG TPA: FAD binding domain-containing protein [Chloroflexota bacterium]